MVYRRKVVSTRCFQLRLGGAVWRQTGFRPLVENGRSPSHQLPWNAISMFGPSHLLSDLRRHHVLVRSDSMAVASYINHQGSLSLRCLFILAERLLRWAQLNLHSQKAMHVPGKLNLWADMLSRSNVPSYEWTLHPQTVQEIWGIFIRPEVNLFA